MVTGIFFLISLVIRLFPPRQEKERVNNYRRNWQKTFNGRYSNIDLTEYRTLPDEVSQALLVISRNFTLSFEIHAWPSPRAPKMTFCHFVKSRLLYCGQFCGLPTLILTVLITALATDCLTWGIDQYYPGFWICSNNHQWSLWALSWCARTISAFRVLGQAAQHVVSGVHRTLAEVSAGWLVGAIMYILCYVESFKCFHWRYMQPADF